MTDFYITVQGLYIGIIMKGLGIPNGLSEKRQVGGRV
jgi:hypothetical protein